MTEWEWKLCKKCDDLFPRLTGHKEKKCQTCRKA